jgi:hypothetical protein
MFNWVYVSATGEFLFGGPCEVTAGAGQERVSLSRNPNTRTERYDGAGGIRSATTQEKAEYDAARTGEAELGQFDGQKMLKAVAIYFATQLNIPLATAKAGVLTIYRTL